MQMMHLLNFQTMKKLRQRLKSIMETYQVYGLWYVCKKVFVKLLTATRLGHLFSFSCGAYRLRIYPTLLTHNLFTDRSYRLADDEVFKKFLKLGDTVVDVGANIGSLTLLSASLVGDKGKVISFEPSPLLFGYLEGNIALNYFTNVSTKNCALGAESAILYLNQGREDDTTYRIESSQSSATHIPVPVATLDEFTTDLKEINLLKIDVEGYECEVLAGATSTLQKTQVAYVELASKNLRALNIEPQKLVHMLEKYFDLYISDGKNFKSFTFEPNREYGTELVCLKKTDNHLINKNIYFKPLAALTLDSIRSVYEKSLRYYTASEHLSFVQIPKPVFWNDLGIGYEWLPIETTLIDELYAGKQWSVDVFKNIGYALGSIHLKLDSEQSAHGDFLPHNIAQIDDKIVFFDFDPPIKYEETNRNLHLSDRYADIASFTVGLWVSHSFKRIDWLFSSKARFVQAFLQGYEKGFGNPIQREKLEKYLDLELDRWQKWYQKDNKRWLIRSKIKYDIIRLVRFVQVRMYGTFDSYGN